jgi:hypothetical protein
VRDQLQRLTDDELRVVAAGAPDIIEYLMGRVYYHEDNANTQLQEILSGIKP